jgi:antitoxin component YwqK of YwqJK toxin-antitoxin module
MENYENTNKFNDKNQKHGRWVELWSNGNLRYDLNYENGQYHGNSKWFYENGQVRYDDNYENGQQHGNCKGFYENGQVRYDDNFQNGEQHGNCKEFYENGQVRYDRNYEKSPKNALGFSNIDNTIAIGCQSFTYEEWLKKYEALAKKHGYSESDIAWYKAEIERVIFVPNKEAIRVIKSKMSKKELQLFSKSNPKVSDCIGNFVDIDISFYGRFTKEELNIKLYIRK